LNFETDDVSWIPVDRVSSLELHAGFASAWPEIAGIVLGAE